MGIDKNMQELIRAVAECDIASARKCAYAVLANDNTKKNEYFVKRYKSILTSAAGGMIELPSELQGLMYCEDVSMTFQPNRYYLTEKLVEIYKTIATMNQVSQKLMELQVPYKNSTLLYGPPGTGKTMFGRFLSYKMHLPFCYLNFSKLIDSYMGGTSKNLAKAFAYASSHPCIFMLDEVDAVSANRNQARGGGAEKELGRASITLMQEFDKLPNDVIVLAATNQMETLDPAFVSRCSSKYEMKPFTEKETKEMIKLFLSDVGYSFPEEEIDNLAKSKDQCSVMTEVIRKLAKEIAKDMCD